MNNEELYRNFSLRTGATRTLTSHGSHALYSLTHLQQHSYNHVVRSASSAVSEFVIEVVSIVMRGEFSRRSVKKAVGTEVFSDA